MIKINLLPGNTGRRRRSLPRIKLPSFGGGTDMWVMGGVLVVLAALGWMGYAYWDVNQQLTDVAANIEEAQADSARFADLIEKTARLTAQRDSIALRVQVIQDIDEGRFVWPHILDEVARAIPDFTWLTGISTMASDDESLVFQVKGNSGNVFAMTQFMENLAASPFIRYVDLVKQGQMNLGVGGGQQVVHDFVLEAAYQAPPVEFIETVPLFGTELSADAGR